MHRWLVTLWFFPCLLLVGCTPVQTQVPALSVSEDRYDALWDATNTVVADYFPILTARRSEGLIVSDYRVGGSLLDPWNQDARQPYYRLEETLHVVRRRAIAQVERKDGECVLRLQVIKERQAYQPPDAAFTQSYSIFDPTVSDRRDIAEAAPPGQAPLRPFGRSPAGDKVTETQQAALAYRQGPAVEPIPGYRPLTPAEANLTWYRLEDDDDLAKEMVLKIAERMQKAPATKPGEPQAPAAEPSSGG
jgi:hypothetical protein